MMAVSCRVLCKYSREWKRLEMILWGGHKTDLHSKHLAVTQTAVHAAIAAFAQQRAELEVIKRHRVHVHSTCKQPHPLISNPFMMTQQVCSSALTHSKTKLRALEPSLAFLHLHKASRCIYHRQVLQKPG